MGCFCLDKVQLLFDSLVGLQLYGTEFIEGFQGFWMDCLNRMVLEIFWRVFSHPDGILNNLTAATFFHHYPGQMILFRKASLLRHLAVSSGSNSDAFFAGAFDSNVAYAFKKGVTYSTFALVRILHIPLHKNDSVAELHSRCQGALAELRDVDWRICSKKSLSNFWSAFSGIGETGSKHVLRLYHWVPLGRGCSFCCGQETSLFCLEPLRPSKHFCPFSLDSKINAEHSLNCVKVWSHCDEVSPVFDLEDAMERGEAARVASFSVGVYFWFQAFFRLSPFTHEEARLYDLIWAVLDYSGVGWMKSVDLLLLVICLTDIYKLFLCLFLSVGSSSFVGPVYLTDVLSQSFYSFTFAFNSPLFCACSRGL